MHNIKLVVFDLAGTTIKDEGQVSAAFISTLKNHGMKITKDEIHEIRGASKREAIHRFVPTAEAADEIYRTFHNKLLAAYRTSAEEVPGTTETFHYLKRKGILIALNTGFDRALMQIILTTTGWDKNLIDAVVCGDDVPKGRPAPDMIFRAMKECGIRNADAVTNVGDTVLDLQAGHNAGVRYNIGVLSGAHTKEQLEREPHSHIIQSVENLQTLWTQL